MIVVQSGTVSMRISIYLEVHCPIRDDCILTANAHCNIAVRYLVIGRL